MSIIKGSENFEVTCKDCSKSIIYLESDVQHKEVYDYIEGWSVHSSFECPNCKSIIVLKD